MTEPLLRAEGVHKRYGGVHALRGVRLEVRAGEVHALVGENGAGKSTIINILAGAVRRDAGSLLLGGREVDFTSPAESQAAGIAVIHQELTALPTMSVAENVCAARLPTRGGWLVHWRALHERSAALLADVGLDIDPRTTMRDLSLSQQQLVEIAKALGMGARLLVMDEPSASLTAHETEHLLALMRRLRAQGVAILYVSHRLAEVFAIADRVTVYRDGAWVDTRDTASTTNEEVVARMVGHDATPTASVEPTNRKILDSRAASTPPALEVRGLERRGGPVPLHGVSFTVHRGEIVGLAGLVGAGRSEVARAVFGADPFDGGELLMDGRLVRFHSPAEAIRAGIAMVPEDRKGLALFLEKPVRWNVSMARLSGLAKRGIVSGRAERALVSDFVERLRVRTPGIETPVRTLSGGNQQKTVLARWLATHPRLLILDEPTHGVDVGAKEEIAALVRTLAAEGMAVLLISSELPEVLALSDRIVVMREGRVATTLARGEADERIVMRHATASHSALLS